MDNLKKIIAPDEHRYLGVVAKGWSDEDYLDKELVRLGEYKEVFIKGNLPSMSVGIVLKAIHQMFAEKYCEKKSQGYSHDYSWNLAARAMHIRAREMAGLGDNWSGDGTQQEAKKTIQYVITVHGVLRDGSNDGRPPIQ